MGVPLIRLGVGAVKFAAPHITRIGARRLTLMMLKQGAKQAIKKGTKKTKRLIRRN